MDISINKNGAELTVTVAGELNTVTSPLLEKEIKDELNGLERLIFDFSDLVYISSAGLRVLFFAQNSVGENGEIVIHSPSKDVFRVLEITGSTDIFVIEQ